MSTTTTTASPPPSSSSSPLVNTTLSQLIKEHNAIQAQQREENERRKKAAKQSMNQLTNELVHVTNDSIGQIFRNQQALGSETKLLLHQSQQFTKNSQSWIQSFQQLNNALKELGDIDNWANHLSADVDEIVEQVGQVIQHRKLILQEQQQKQDEAST